MLIIEIVLWLSLGAIIYSYAGYPILLVLSGLFTRRTASVADDNHQPKVSILMAAYNEIEFIREKLENCLALDYPSDKIEILIGSDGSDDGTNEVVEEYAERGVRLLDYRDRRGKMAVINRLVREAKHEICLFSDVSEMFDPDALTKLVRHMADPSVGLVAGNHIFNSSGSGIGLGTKVYRAFKRLCWRNESRIYSTCRCDGPIYICRKALFPFPPDGTINDDIAVPFGVLTAGKRIVFEPTAVCRGDVHASSKAFFAQKIRINAGRYQLLSRSRSLFRPWPIRRWLIFVSHHLLPLFVPWFMVFALISNVLLCFEPSSLYQILMLPHGLFYALAAFGYLGEQLKVRIPPFAIPYYFVASNAGSLAGFFAFALRKQKATWRKLDSLPVS